MGRVPEEGPLDSLFTEDHKTKKTSFNLKRKIDPKILRVPTVILQWTEDGTFVDKNEFRRTRVGLGYMGPTWSGKGPKSRRESRPSPVKLDLRL